jgi:hypothetical protein
MFHSLFCFLSKIQNDMEMELIQKRKNEKRREKGQMIATKKK